MFNWNIFRDPVIPRLNAFKYEPRHEKLFGASDQVTQKPARLSLEISDLDSIAIILSRQRRTTKALIRLRGCAGWSASLLFAYGIKQVFSWCGSDDPPHDKTNKMTVRPAKTQISLCICPVWSESSVCAQWVSKDPSFLHADSKDWSDWADPSLHWAHMPFCWFCHEAAQFC